MTTFILFIWIKVFEKKLQFFFTLKKGFIINYFTIQLLVGYYLLAKRLEQRTFPDAIFCSFLILAKRLERRITTLVALRASGLTK